MNAESFFISLFGSRSRKIGDDGALVGKHVYSKDAFFEGVHFERRWMTPEQIAYRAMMVNLSDAYAMNAVPRYALLAVAMPKSMPLHEMASLYRGFERAAAEHGVEIIGGDTIANVKLDITVTVVSETRQPLLRKGLKPGHCIAYTGVLGRSLRELRYLMAGGKLHRGSRFNALTLRRGFVCDATSKLSCGMDISDGLFSDLQKLSEANRLGFRFGRRIGRRIGCSGEEYEMLVGFDPRCRRAVERIARKHRTPLTVIGRARRGRFVNRCKAHHF